jgi:drug/metabolite transporter (DMT)-like permease
MLGILSVFLSSCFFGFSNAYWKKAVANHPFLPIIFVRGLYSCTFFFICCLLDEYSGVFQPLLGVSPALTLEHVGLSIALCLFSGMGLYFFVKSVKESPVSLVIPLSSLNIFGLLTAVFVLGETWKNIYYVAFLLVLLGIYLIYQQEIRFKSPQLFMKAMLGGLLASFFWGVSYTLFKYPIAWLGVLRFSFLLEFSVTSMVGMLIGVQGIRWSYLPQRAIRILAFCLVMGSVLLHVAYQFASMTQIVFAGKFQLIISLLAGQFLYREKLGVYQWLGISLLITSIYLIA